MEKLNIELDFTGVSAATGGIGYLKAGLHTAQIVEFSYFDDSGRLYVYMMTDGVRHKDSFNTSSAASMPFVKAFLLSAGVPESKLAGKSKIPFEKLAGKTVYFNYVPPEMDSTGKAVMGSYPKYTFYGKGRYTQMQAVANLTPQDVEVETSNGAGKPVSQAAETKAVEDFDFLAD